MVESGKKITLDDMKALQLDVVDVYARELAQRVIQMVKDVVDSGVLKGNEVKELEEMVRFFDGWDGSHDKESLAASVFERWHIIF